MIQVVGVSLLLNLVVRGFNKYHPPFRCHHAIRMDGTSARIAEIWYRLHGNCGAFAFFQAISLTISASLRSANKAIYPMLVTVLVNIMNIVGKLLPDIRKVRYAGTWR